MDESKFDLVSNKEVDKKEFSEIHNELLFYLEDKVLNNLATDSEIIAYEEYRLYEEFDVESDVFKKLLNEMEEIYMNGYK